MTPIDVTELPAGRWGSKIASESEKLLSDVCVVVKRADLLALLKRLKKKGKKGGVVSLLQVATPLVDEASLFDVCCINCSQHVLVHETTIPVFCSTGCLKVWRGKVEAMALMDRAIVAPKPEPILLPKPEDQEPKVIELKAPATNGQVATMEIPAVIEDPEPTPAERVQFHVSGFLPDPRLSLSVSDCLRYIQLRADGLDDAGLRKALGGIDPSELAGLRRSLDTYATAYRLQGDGDLRKYLLDLLKDEMVSKGVRSS